jgi:uncharacterized membrane protein
MRSAPPAPPPPPEIWSADNEIAPPLEGGRIALLLHDHALQFLLGLGLLINLALFSYLVIRFDALPDLLPLHFDATGLPDRIEAKNGIFALPTIGLIVLALNIGLGIPIHRRERIGTRLLAAGALLVQVLMWLAVSSIIGGLV